MKKDDFAKIEYYFPENTQNVRDGKDLVGLIMNRLQETGSNEYAGFPSDKELESALLREIKDINLDTYQPPTIKEKGGIEESVFNTLDKCFEKLEHPYTPIFIFMFPWSADKEDIISFGGAMGTAAHKRVMHFYLSPNNLRKYSIENTVAHEYNHLVFYSLNDKENYSILDNMVIEGLAEVFREEVVGGEQEPWAVALTPEEVERELDNLKPVLDSTDQELFNDIFFGSKEYKRWTGYSAGYRYAKKFRKNHPEYSWKEIMQTKPENIIQK